MKKTTKVIILLALVAIILGLVLKNKKNTPPQNSSTIKIGSILPLTGGYASIAEEVNRGAQLATDEAKAKGINVDYIVEDDEFKASTIVNATTKLIRQDKVDAVFTMAVEEIKPSAPVFNQAHIPILATWDSNEYVKNAGDYAFSIGFATEANGQEMADFIYNKQNIKKIAVIQQIDEWSELISSAFVKRYQELGGQVVVNEKVLTTEQDFRTLITKAKIANAQGIYFPMNPPANSRIITQAKQLGFSGQLLSGDALIQDEIDEAGNAANGTYFTGIYAANDAELQKKYQSKYGQESSAPEFVTFGYDAINTILEADKISHQKNLSLAESLKQVKLDGTGDAINFNGKQYSEKVEKFFKVVDGKPQPVE